MVVIAVQEHHEHIRVAEAGVAPGETGGDRTPVIQDRSDVDRGIIVNQTDRGALRDGLSFQWQSLEKIGDRGGVRPRRIIERSIDGDRSVHSCGPSPGREGM